MQEYILNHPSKICHTHKIPPPALFKAVQCDGIKMVSIIRDPRDQLISLIFFEHKTGNYKDDPMVDLPNRYKPFRSEDVQYILDLILLHDYWPYGNGAHISMFQRLCLIPYLKNDFVHVVKFEELVGKRGGGCNQAQKKTLEDLSLFLKLDNFDIDYVAENLFGGTWSFRTGQIGEWKKYFNEDHIEGFRKRYGQVLEYCGYE